METTTVTPNTMTLAHAAKLAILCQDACNLGGLVKSLNEIICDVLRPHPECTGTRWINEHPIVYMFTYKLMSLTGHEPLDQWTVYSEMEAKCQALVNA